MFQSTPPHGRRPNADQSRLADTHVSIHASAREATRAPPAPTTSRACFNPRLRTGGDVCLWLYAAGRG